MSTTGNKLIAITFAMFAFPAFADTRARNGRDHQDLQSAVTIQWLTLLSEKRSLVVSNIRLFGMTRAGNLPPNRISTSSQQIRRNMRLNMMGTARWASAYENGHKDTVDPEAFTIVNGKLYVNHTKYWTTEWRKNESENISRADKNWLTVKDTPEPTK